MKQRLVKSPTKNSAHILGRSFQQELQHRLREAKHPGRYRRLALAQNDGISFCDNDYAGLREDDRVIAAASVALKQYGVGAGASRLVASYCELVEKLECQLATLKGAEAALVFPSGYSVNLGVLSTLVSKSDMILADRLCHASLIDGMRLSEARFQRFAHQDIQQVERLLQQHRAQYRQVFIVTESVFSMDGDCSDVDALQAMAERYDAQLLIDDAHGLGVLPPRERAAQSNLIQLGTLSKAVGTQGGYICATKEVIDVLVNYCRPFIYTTALPPATVAAASKAIEILQAEPWRSEQAIAHAQHFAAALHLPRPESAIVPWIVGDEERAVHYAQMLAQEGMLVSAIRPPTVPEGSARLRFTFSARHQPQEVAALIAAVQKLKGEA